jgi:hypothetical protein
MEDSIRVCYYLKKEEFEEFRKQAIILHQEKAIPRPTVGAFAKAAAYKFYNEFNEVLRRQNQNAHRK